MQSHHNPQGENYHLNEYANDQPQSHYTRNGPRVYGAPTPLHPQPINSSEHQQPNHPAEMLWRQKPYDSRYVDNHKNWQGGRRGWQVPKSFHGVSDRNYDKGGHVYPKHYSL